MTAGPGPNDAVGADAIVSRHYRRNLFLLIAEAASFMCGLAFFDSATVYPVLLVKLGASDALIGVARFVQVLGFTLPALVAAHYIHGRATHKRFLLTTCAVARVGLFTVPIALLYADSHPGPVLAWTMSVIALFWIMDGACAVSWFDIVAKAIPARVRGRFFGGMQLSAGLGAAGAGVIVAAVLHSSAWPFPHNFALLAGLWFLGAMGSQLGLSLLVEPPGRAEPTENRLTFGAYLRQSGPLLRRSPRLRRLIMTRVLLDGAGVAAPFYVLFAQRDLGVSLRMVGIYTVAQSIGRVAAGPLWGWLSDRVGTTTSVRAIALSVAVAPVAALTATNGSPWLMLVVFGLLGAVMDGTWMVMSTAILESCAEDERPLAVGVASVCQTPGALYGPIGGFMAGALGYRPVFAAACLFALSGLLVSFGIPPVGSERKPDGHLVNGSEPGATSDGSYGIQRSEAL
ncbi:MAG: MFS transporter [Armatimonadetes bacterium]|nr:MFS transporter [Armatimonadota bacterium]